MDGWMVGCSKEWMSSPRAATVAGWSQVVVWRRGVVLGWRRHWLHFILHAVQQHLPRDLHLLGQVLVLFVLIIFVQQVLLRPLVKLPR